MYYFGFALLIDVTVQPLLFQFCSVRASSNFAFGFRLFGVVVGHRFGTPEHHKIKKKSLQKSIAAYPNLVRTHFEALWKRDQRVALL